jgi:5'(3')-deoxyribonucleotidase
MKKKIFFDVDSTLCNSPKRFIELYNEKYNQNADWKKVYKWDFSDVCPLLENAEEIFAHPEFYNAQLEYMDVYIPSVLNYLHTSGEYEIDFVTIGNKDNLYFKKNWLQRNFPYITDDHYHLLNKIKMGKSEIDMSDSILIDDNYINLLTSNADLKICMYDIMEWNKDVEKSGFKRLKDSLDLYNYLSMLERDGKFNG